MGTSAYTNLQLSCRLGSLGVWTENDMEVLVEHEEAEGAVSLMEKITAWTKMRQRGHRSLMPRSPSSCRMPPQQSGPLLSPFSCPQGGLGGPAAQQVYPSQESPCSSSRCSRPAHVQRFDSVSGRGSSSNDVLVSAPVRSPH